MVQSCGPAHGDPTGCFDLPPDFPKNKGIGLAQKSVQDKLQNQQTCEAGP
jgi:hypothetical protein